MDIQALVELLAIKGQLNESQVQMLARAIEVFRTPDMAYKWFLSPVLALGNTRPVELTSDEAGIHEIMKILGRIEQGVYS
ncbi:MbcA/ParS/Xre antitoxin family protein [Geobacter sp.]|uniref:MbcA/ParS/Xre antitoxin family protein n=1 Tax=Geobacter sp. TaxID=46610 RepID=UPI001AC71740|nr:MbcA/ParS/Xre antitoxin family protein [Geobacter sp.]CAG0968695.1 hypothetical protein ANAEL_01056 [Anaerolineales bacterium]